MRHNQNRRSRGRNNRKGPNPLTRSFESNGPDVKVRGTAAHIADKYMTLARDAQSSGDTVSAENYLQHAEHYYRIVMAAQAQFQQSQPQFREGGRGAYDDDRQMNGRAARPLRLQRRRRQERRRGRRRPVRQRRRRGRRRSRLPPADAAHVRWSSSRAGREQDQRPRGPRPEQRYDRRPDRPDYRDNGATQRLSRRQDRGERPDYREGGNRPERFQRADEPQPEDSAAASGGRRRSRQSR